MIKNIVFEGGGYRGAIAYAGSIARMDLLKVSKNIVNVSGTSIGALIGGLYSVGYGGNEIYQILSDDKFNIKKITSTNILSGVYNFITRQGVVNNKKIEKAVEKLIRNKIGYKNLTFRELHSFIYDSEVANLKDLHVVVYNSTRRVHETFSHMTTPNMKISKAIAISCSIPLMFTSTKINGDKYCDGGVTNNYNIEYFDDTYDVKETIGFRIDSALERQIADDNSTPKYMIGGMTGFILKMLLLYGIVNYVKNIVIGIYDKANNEHLKKVNHDRSTYLNDFGFSSTNFNIKEQDKRWLFEDALVKKIKSLQS
jgi:predicted acylesterase/phospholipase RssA